MKPRSARMARLYKDRGPLVRAWLDAHPACERCWRHRATEVHERLSRGRGGSILDETNLVALCHVCHRWVTENPAAATVEGFLSSAGQHPFLLGSRMRCAMCRMPADNYLHRVAG